MRAIYGRMRKSAIIGLMAGVVGPLVKVEKKASVYYP
jgi:hypothetical protein